MSLLKWMVGASAKPTASDTWTDTSEKFTGLENFGNTCYCNSVLQALYYCKPFRECVNNYPNAFISFSLPTPQPSTPILSATSNQQSYFPPISMPPTNVSKKDLASQGSKSRSSFEDKNDTKPQSAPSKIIYSSATSSSATLLDTGSAMHHITVPGLEDSIFLSLKNLFWKLTQQRKKHGIVAPTAFVAKLKKENELFRGNAHQDAHEFLMYLLNAIAEDVLGYQKKMAQEHQQQQGAKPPMNTIYTNGFLNGHAQTHYASSRSSLNGRSSEESTGDSTPKLLFEQSNHSESNTWIHQLFEGILTNETRCLTCETVTCRDESFLDLSIDIQENSSVTSCLRQFSASEMLCQRNKFFCDYCCSLQEAEKRMKIKKLPYVLALHLKRFKYQERLQRYIKLSYRVMFPFELRLFNTSDDAEDSDRMYELFAIVVHIGSGPHHGHYVAIIKTGGKWVLFDDDTVETIDESEIAKYFGDTPGTGSGYVLFYQATELESLDPSNSTNSEPAPSAPVTLDTPNDNQFIPLPSEPHPKFAYHASKERATSYPQTELEVGMATAATVTTSAAPLAPSLDITTTKDKSEKSGSFFNLRSRRRDKDKDKEREKEKEKEKRADGATASATENGDLNAMSAAIPAIPITAMPLAEERRWFGRLRKDKDKFKNLNAMPDPSNNDFLLSIANSAAGIPSLSRRSPSPSRSNGSSRKGEMEFRAQAVNGYVGDFK
ncbi:uncharacterized protein VTP21DRAFT_11041 [Calcarisporiella thermophila]|uniref:uncharacterized protein n=1 Tax=Calcarisporiella thermophila TaxID=911321 RepID=UPI0037429B91